MAVEAELAGRENIRATPTDRRWPDDRQPEPEARPRARLEYEKPPEEWVTGDEPMTGAQASYLKTLSEEAGEPFEAELTKAQASQRIDELQARTGRGQ
jgi:hypothetical protein